MCCFLFFCCCFFRLLLLWFFGVVVEKGCPPCFVGWDGGPSTCHFQAALAFAVVKVSEVYIYYCLQPKNGH